MSISLPIFPGFKPGQEFSVIPQPARASTWNYKETATWNNERQQSVNGRVVVTKYWSNPIWEFEWTYGYIKDNPLDHNPFYPTPIGFTDLQVLKGFYGGMQGGGNQFAYQPPDNVIGPTIGSVGSVQISGNVLTFSSLPSGAATKIAPYVGKSLLCVGSTFTGATFLNGQYLPILSVNTGSNTISCQFNHGTYGPTADTGTITVGQVLSNPDANNNVELVRTFGAYPTLPVPAGPPFVTLVNESVQLIDTSALTVYDSTGATLSFTLNSPNTVAPYPGYVLHFSSAPTNFPLTASFTYYYLCRFTEDTQEYENFMATLWACSSVKFQQDRA